MNTLEQIAARLRAEFNKIYDGTKSVFNSLRLGGKTLATIESERSTAINSAIQTNVTDKLGQANGIATLDGNGQVPTSQLPSSVLGGMVYKGAWDASTANYPASPSAGWYYIVSVAGTISGKAYSVGDWMVYNGTAWDRIDATDEVQSVNGKVGVVVLNVADIPDLGTYAEFLAEFETGLL